MNRLICVNLPLYTISDTHTQYRLYIIQSIHNSDMESNASSMVNNDKFDTKGKVGHLMISDNEAIERITSALDIDGEYNSFIM